MPVAPGAWGRMVRRDPFDDLAALLDLPRPTLVDGGANRGTTVAALRARFPGALIHAFEPIPALARGLRARFAADPRLIVHQAALAAEEGFLAFQVSGERRGVVGARRRATSRGATRASTWTCASAWRCSRCASMRAVPEADRRA